MKDSLIEPSRLILHRLPAGHRVLADIALLAHVWERRFLSALVEAERGQRDDLLGKLEKQAHRLASEAET